MRRAQLWATVSFSAMVVFLPNSARAQQGGGSYRFDEGSSVAAFDSSGAGNTGSIDGATFISPGRDGAGYALRFRPGSVDRVSLPPSLFDGFSNTVYLEAWVRVVSYPTGSGCTHTVFQKRSPYNDFFLSVGENGSLAVALYGTRSDGLLGDAGGFWGPGSIPLHTWTKVACWYDGETMRGYVNDVLVGSHSLILMPDWSGLRTEIGNDSYDAGINCGDYGLSGDVDDVIVARSRVLPIRVDIRQDAINPRSRGVIPVAVLSTAAFDAATVNTGTVRFGTTGAEAPPSRSALEDVDGDGLTDLVLQFSTPLTGIRCEDGEAILTGVTYSGIGVSGKDAFRTSGCK